jgi:hypothetical protein
MKKHREIYRGWKIEAFGSRFKYWELTKKKAILIGDDISVIRDQIDQLNKQSK